jgi:3-hydroxybutyrate dehydrogenase
MRLQGKVALVTGGASGIGHAIAKKFTSEGAHVAIVDLHQTVFQADITDETQVEAAVAAILERYGVIDIVVNNAGIQIISSLDQLSYADWRKILAVHLDGAFLVTRACLRHMYSTGRGGSILFMGSVHSKLASVLKAPYVTAKHGLLGLCKAVAKEGAPHGVRANLICPGFVRTRMVETQIPEQARVLGISEEDVISKVMLKDTVDGQFTTTDEIASAAVFFASAESLAFTGQSINVTHGWFME